MLDFLEADICHRPEQLRLLNPALIDLITSLAGKLEVALNAPLLINDEQCR
jgi:hypothetical protein